MFLYNSFQLMLVAQTRLAEKRIEPIQFVVETSEPAGVSRAIVILTLVLVVAAIAIAGLTMFRRSMPGVVNSGQSLFAELCRANHLTRRQRKLLLDIATRKQAACPSLVFLDINLWAADPEQPQPISDTKAQAELHRLRSLLFTQGKLPVPAGLNAKV